MITIGWNRYKGQENRWEADIVIQLATGKHDRKRYRCPHKWSGHPDRTRVEDANRPKKADNWASQKAEVLLTRLQAGESSQRPPLFIQWWDEYIAWCRDVAQQESGTIALKKSHARKWLMPALAKTRLDEIDDAVIVRLCTRIGLKGGRVNVLQTLSACLQRAVTAKKITAMPCRFGTKTGVHLKAVNRPKQRNEYYPEYDSLLSAAKRISPTAYVATLLGGEASMRAGEIIGLEWSAIRNNKIEIVKQIYRGETKPPKHRKTRSVAMTERLSEALRQLPRRGLHVISHEDGRPVTYLVLRVLLGRVEVEAGLTPTSTSKKPMALTHLGRHTFCTRLAQRGASITEIRDLAGHHSIAITEGYMHHAPGALDAAIGRLNGENPETDGTEMLELRNA